MENAPPWNRDFAIWMLQKKKIDRGRCGRRLRAWKNSLTSGKKARFVAALPKPKKRPSPINGRNQIIPRSFGNENYWMMSACLASRQVKSLARFWQRTRTLLQLQQENYKRRLLYPPTVSPTILTSATFVSFPSLHVCIKARRPWRLRKMRALTENCESGGGRRNTEIESFAKTFRKWRARI